MRFKSALTTLFSRTKPERLESAKVGFADLVRPWAVISDLGRHLIADQGLGERLTAIPCPCGDRKASERIAALLQACLR